MQIPATPPCSCVAPAPGPRQALGGWGEDACPGPQEGSEVHTSEAVQEQDQGSHGCCRCCFILGFWAPDSGAGMEGVPPGKRVRGLARICGGPCKSAAPVAGPRSGGLQCGFDLAESWPQALAHAVLVLVGFSSYQAYCLQRPACFVPVSPALGPPPPQPAPGFLPEDLQLGNRASV